MINFLTARLQTLIHHTFSSLKIRNYRLFFFGQAVSLSGTWMQTIAQDWLVLNLSHSGTVLGLVTALQFLPVLLLGPIGGVIADRFPKRKILYLTQTGAGLLALIFGLLVATGSIRLWMVFLLAPCLGLINTIDNPTRQTFVFEMVGNDHLKNAVTLNATLQNFARVIGPTIAGILIATVGLAPCFIINAISYIAVLYMLYKMRSNELHHSPLITKLRGRLREGLEYVISNQILRNTLIMLTIIGTLTYEFSVTLPLLAQYTFHGNAGTYASLSAALGTGSIIGGLYTAAQRKISPQMLVSSALFFGISVLLSALAPNFLFAMIFMVFVGIFSIHFLSLANTTLQIESLPEMRGRVMSLWAMAFLGSTPIGGPIIGLIGEHAGPRCALAISGLAAVIAAAIGAIAIRNGNYHKISTGIEITSSSTDTQENSKIP